MKNASTSLRHLFWLPVLLLVFSSSCVSLRPVEFSGIGNFRTDLNVNEPAVLFDVKLKNPNNYGVTLRSMGVSLKISDKTLAEIAVSGKTHITGLEKTSVPVVLKPSLNDIKNMAASGFSGLLSGKKQSLTVEGELVVSKFFIRKKLHFKEEIGK